MKKLNVCIFLLVILFSNTVNAELYRFCPVQDDTTNLEIGSKQDIEKYSSRDTTLKNKVKTISFGMSDFYEVTDFINEFPKLNTIDFYRRCKNINISRPPKNLKTILILDEVNSCFKRNDSLITHTNKIKNLEQLEFIENIHYYWENKNISYFKDFQKFKHLKHITLKYCRGAESLDKDIYTLTKLESLQLDYTSFKKIPKGICRLKNLKELTIESEFSLTAPDCLFEMDSLKVITIKGRSSDVNKFYEKYKDKNPRIKINLIGGQHYW